MKIGSQEYERSSNPDYRNGRKTKKIRGNFGETEIEVPQDRDGSFEPKVVKKRQKDISGIILFFLHSMAISQQKSFHLLNLVPRTHFLHAVLQFLLQGQAPNQHRPSVCFLTYLHEKKAEKCFPCIFPEFHSLCLQYAAKPADLRCCIETVTLPPE